MLATIECKECDLTLFTARFNQPDFITMRSLVDIAKEHYKLSGHTLVEIIVTLIAKELKGD